MGVFHRLLSISANKGRSAPDRRGAARVAVAMTGLLSTCGCDEEVSVVNLSSGGALIESALPLCAGERAFLTIDGWGSVPVVVRWAAGRRIGVAFER